MAASSGRVVRVINLGRMGFLQAHDVQVRYARHHLDQLAGKANAPEALDILLLVEHNPVYTVGLRSQEYDEKKEQQLKKLGAEFFRTNRGGLITFHGPGQLVAYPILNLHHFGQGIRAYVAALEQSVIRTCQHFNIKAGTTKDTGVWVGDSKIAAIGVHGSRFVTTHGLALNCDIDLNWFRHIIPCGIKDKGVTSISKELGVTVSVKKVISPFLAAFEQEFDCQLEFTMFDESDASLLRSEEEEPANKTGGGLREGGSGRAGLTGGGMQGLRLMSTSSMDVEETGVNRAVRGATMTTGLRGKMLSPRFRSLVPMW